jgi:GNAT superfamily N-acetyltransferase
MSEDLDNPVWAALTGPHRHLGLVGARAAFYDADIAPFAGLRDFESAAFDQLAAMATPNAVFAFCTAQQLTLPKGWTKLQGDILAQMLCADPPVPPHGADEFVDLAAEDVPAMLALADETKPGPFSAGTIRLGHYIGVRDSSLNKLAAMAGQRLRTKDAIEISAVCTTESHRGRGLAGRLMLTLANEAQTASMLSFLHVRTSNIGAISLYEKLGFQHRATMHLTIASTPRD